jgi:hypothetical protein
VESEHVCLAGIVVRRFLTVLASAIIAAWRLISRDLKRIALEAHPRIYLCRPLRSSNMVVQIVDASKRLPKEPF